MLSCRFYKGFYNFHNIIRMFAIIDDNQIFESDKYINERRIIVLMEETIRLDPLLTAVGILMLLLIIWFIMSVMGLR